MQDEERATEVVQEIGAAILSEPGVDGASWDRLAVIVHFADDSAELYGFLREGEEARALEFGDGALLELFLALREAMHEGPADGSGWIACLCSITRGDGEFDFDIEFEYEDERRWRITPETIDEVVPRILAD